MEHTPGPWSVGFYEPTENFRKIAQHACVCDPKTMMLIAICGPAEDEQSQKDADFIAAAPDLLAACEEMLYHITHSMDCTHGNGFTYDYCPVEKLRAAISKAKGEVENENHL